MKARIFIVAAMILLHFHTRAQVVTIPDPNFVNFLNNNGYAGAMSGNQMDTQHNSVQSAWEIDCSNENISNLEGIQYFPNLNILICKNNPLSSLPLITGPLWHLDVSDCNFTILQGLPNSLANLACNNNPISSLPGLPTSLALLDCSTCNLTSLPSLPTGLVELECWNNSLSQLPPLPATLDKLVCGYNQLTSLPALPTGISSLSCNHNQLTSLPSLALTTLNFFDCRSNNLASLPVLPMTLNSFVCSDNPITALPFLPSILHSFIADGTLLSALPALHIGMYEISCQNSFLTSLPPLPYTLHTLRVSNNQLTSLPELPDSMNILSLSNNPYLVCLPQLKKINNLSFLNTSISCLPNYGTVINSSPLLASIPLCDEFNANGCNFYYNIGGQVYDDANGNCINQAGEAVVPNLKINLYQAGTLVQQTLTSQGGLYTLEAPFGTYDYTVDTVGMPFSVNCPSSGNYTSVLSMADSIDLNMDFGLECLPGFDVGVWSLLATGFIPGDTNQVKLKAGDLSQLFNMSCADGVAGTVQVSFSGPVSFVGPAPGSMTPVVNGNVLEYQVPDFGVAAAASSFNFFMTTDTLAQLGDTVCFDVIVTPLSGDNNTANNQFNYCGLVTSSFDPNDKHVYPSGEISPYQSWLTYTINFQNTGNAPAQHIVITDTLDANLQEATFTFLDASHDLFTSVTGNIVRFIFPNINLPDSISNEPGSHGYVQFKVKPVTTLTTGDSITNTAAIYFDFNQPVITNTVVNVVGQPVSVTEYSFDFVSVYPNPAHDILNISSTLTDLDYELFDLTGRKILVGNISASDGNIDIKGLQPGCYLLSMWHGKNHFVQKVIVY